MLIAVPIDAERGVHTSARSLGFEARQILEQLPDMNRADVIELGEVGFTGRGMKSSICFC
jgi:hypothetical protein